MEGAASTTRLDQTAAAITIGGELSVGRIGCGAHS